MEQHAGAGQRWFRCPDLRCSAFAFADQMSLMTHVNQEHMPLNPSHISVTKPHTEVYNSNLPTVLQHNQSISTQDNPIYIADSVSGPLMSPEEKYTNGSPLAQNARGVVNYPGHPPPQSKAIQGPIVMDTTERTNNHRRMLEESVLLSPNAPLIKSLMVRHFLFAYPKTDVETEMKMRLIFTDFCNECNIPGYKPKTDDRLLWQLFKLKVDAIRADMIKNKEVVRTGEGYILHTTDLLRGPSVVNATSPTNRGLANPKSPKTPVSDSYATALEIWTNFDAQTQAKLFRDQILAAKDAQNLPQEWDKWVEEEIERRKTRQQQKDQAKQDKTRLEEAARQKQAVAIHEATRKEIARRQAEARLGSAARSEEARLEGQRNFTIISAKARDQKTKNNPSVARVEEAKHQDRCAINYYRGVLRLEDGFDSLDAKQQAEEIRKVTEWVMQKRRKRGVDAYSVLKRSTQPVTPVLHSEPFEAAENVKAFDKVKDQIPKSEVDDESKAGGPDSHLSIEMSQPTGVAVVNLETKAEKSNTSDPVATRNSTPSKSFKNNAIQPQQVPSRPVGVSAMIAAKMEEIKAKREAEKHEFERDSKRLRVSD